MRDTAGIGAAETVAALAVTAVLVLAFLLGGTVLLDPREITGIGTAGAGLVGPVQVAAAPSPVPSVDYPSYPSYPEYPDSEDYPEYLQPAETDGVDALTTLEAQLDVDATSVELLAGMWVPQLASSRPGLVVDGVTFGYPEILDEHFGLRAQYGTLLVWSGDWSSFNASDFYVTVVAIPFTSSEGANAWCDAAGIDADHCFAKRLSRVNGPEGSTAHR